MRSCSRRCSSSARYCFSSSASSSLRRRGDSAVLNSCSRASRCSALTGAGGRLLRSTSAANGVHHSTTSRQPASRIDQGPGLFMPRAPFAVENSGGWRSSAGPRQHQRRAAGPAWLPAWSCRSRGRSAGPRNCADG
ncbi:MAG: hypothetical protein DPW14_13730 [Planctomycetes bacterium]|nr:hypothetical protein [Planctomycetota bacterium]